MTEKAIATTEAMPAAETPATREEQRYLAPPVDIYETEEGLCVTADLPGVDSKDVEVRVDNGILTMSGRVTAAAATSDALHEEFALGDYFRQFRLNEEVDQGRISAELKQGVLRLLLPRRAETQPRRIDVQVG